MKKNVLILWAIAALCVISSVPLFVQGNAGAGAVGVAAAVILFVVGLRKKNSAQPGTGPESRAAAPASGSTSTAAQAVDFPAVSGFELKYSYADVEVLESVSARGAVTVGASVDLKEEMPSGGTGRVSVVQGGARVGFLPSNRLENMVHDFRARGGAVLAKVSSVGPDGVKVALGYYDETETEYTKLVNSDAARKVYKLTSNGGEEKQENISLCSVGDSVDCELDTEKDKYCAVASGEIGFFPKAAEALIEGGARAFVAEVTEDDETGKYSVSVALFPQA